MKLQFDLSPKFIEKNLQAKIKKLERSIVNDLATEMEQSAIKNFKRAEREVPADNPRVDVHKEYLPAQNLALVICGGEQLLFIEFGAGAEHYYEGSMVSEKGEKAPRKEIGILDVGEFGKHRGKDRSWVYLSETGREALHTHDIGVSGRTGLHRMRTGGIRPQRALWRARNNAIRKVIYGRVGKRRIG